MAFETISQPPSGTPTGPGARFDPTQQLLTFAVFSRHATRIEVWLYAQPKDADELERIPLAPGVGGTWTLAVSLADLRGRLVADAIYYGYRAWGPNWPFDSAWAPGTALGFVSDVDEDGNRFNPNKLLLDPYATEISHDPAPRLSFIDPNEYADDYDSGDPFRTIDTGRMAPKSVLPLSGPASPAGTGRKPTRPLRDDIIYEVHLRGLTRRDPGVPEAYRGTFRGAALKAPYLRELGVTAVEFLPVFQFASEQNDDGDPRGDNYWGYMTLGFFAPNRRYAADQTPGGPTREFQEMVRAFHDAGIKVFLDVVYNHTGEGLLKRTTETDDSRGDDAQQLAPRACLLSLRGLDNATYYTLRSRPDLDGGRRRYRYQDNSGCGPSLNVCDETVQRFILDSLRYWSDVMGVDGFRFDLAPVLGNRLREEGFVFDASDPESLLQQLGRGLPLRGGASGDGVDLIAEPWAVGFGTYQLGQFPDGWAEWNDVYRTVMRRAENRLGCGTVLPYEVANAVAGSEQQFRQSPQRSAARPWNSVNYLASHDGYTLRDLFCYGGNDAWDHGGDPARQRKAIRNALALLMTSAGVPMFMGGDELMRTQGGRENTVAVDDASVYLNWDNLQAYARAAAEGDAARLSELGRQDDVRTYEFARAMIRLRNRYPALRPAEYFTGQARGGTGLKDITWCARDGGEVSGDGWSDPSAHFLGYRVDTQADTGAMGVRSIYVAYNWHDDFVEIALPPNCGGARWVRLADTAEWLEPAGNLDRDGTVIECRYGLHERSVAIFLEQ